MIVVRHTEKSIFNWDLPNLTMAVNWVHSFESFYGLFGREILVLALQTSNFFSDFFASHTENAETLTIVFEWFTSICLHTARQSWHRTISMGNLYFSGVPLSIINEASERKVSANCPRKVRFGNASRCRWPFSSLLGIWRKLIFNWVLRIFNG